MRGIPHTYEECYNEAKKHSLYVDFIMKSPSYWQRANKQGWIKDYTWLKHREVKSVAQYTMDGEFIRTFRTCEEAGKSVSSAKKAGEGIRNCCNGKTSFSYKYKWLYVKDMDRAEELFKEREKPICRDPYTNEEIKAEAGKYRTLKEFRENASRYFYVAYKRGIIDELHLERDLNPYKDNLYSIYVYEFSDHSAYVGLTWKKEDRDNRHRDKADSAVKQHSMENGLEIPEPIYPLENLSAKEALLQEDNYKIKYMNEGWNVLNRAKTGLISGSLGASHGKYSLKKLRECVRECAANGETLTDFREKHAGLYYFASGNGYMHELRPLKRRKVEKMTYTEEYCYCTASQYDNVRDFREKEASVYQTSKLRGWFNSYYWLKRERKRGGVIISKFTCFSDWEIMVFGSVKEASKYFGYSSTNKTFAELKKRAEKSGYEAVSLVD